MNILSIIPILAGIFAVGFCTYCDELPRDYRINVFRFLTRYSGHLKQYTSLDYNSVCGVAYFNPYGNKFLIKKPNRHDDRFYYYYDRPGVWKTQNAYTGKILPRQVSHYREYNDGGYACFYTCECDGWYFKSYDCLATSPYYAEQAERGLRELNFVLRNDQTVHYCRNPRRSGYGIFFHPYSNYY